jgi:hypothetical protein
MRQLLLAARRKSSDHSAIVTAVRSIRTNALIFAVVGLITVAIGATEFRTERRLQHLNVKLDDVSERLSEEIRQMRAENLAHASEIADMASQLSKATAVAEPPTALRGADITGDVTRPPSTLPTVLRPH